MNMDDTVKCHYCEMDVNEVDAQEIEDDRHMCDGCGQAMSDMEYCGSYNDL